MVFCNAISLVVPPHNGKGGIANGILCGVSWEGPGHLLVSVSSWPSSIQSEGLDEQRLLKLRQGVTNTLGAFWQDVDVHS